MELNVGRSRELKGTFKIDDTYRNRHEDHAFFEMSFWEGQLSQCPMCPNSGCASRGDLEQAAGCSFMTHTAWRVPLFVTGRVDGRNALQSASRLNSILVQPCACDLGGRSS